MAFYDTNSLPTKGEYGYAKAIIEYDNQGNGLGTTFFDTNGELLQY